MASPRSDDDDKRSIDPSAPLKGTVVCCTSIPPEQRTRIDLKVAELGGVHKYDLTPDVTHLIVGDYDTPKYRHVARERQDVRPMDARWIEAVNELWRNDDDVDYAALEREHQLRPLERGVGGGEDAEQDPKKKPDADSDDSTSGRDALLICLTGFGDEREAIADLIKANGGRYKGDLTRRCTHLIVNKPEGKKFAAAQSWGIRAVTLDWLRQSVARGMILAEARFDPLLPKEEQGVGAWVKRDPKAGNKRTRSAASNGTGDAERGARKLRKTASMKLSSQRNNLWGDILGRPASREYSFAREDPQGDAADDAVQQRPPPPTEIQGVLSDCVFYTHGFGPQRTPVLRETLAALGGHIATSLEQAATCAAPSSNDRPWHRFLVVPQSSQPDTHPSTPSDDVHVVTEFYVERCLHHRRFFDPSEQVLGRPFPLFPIPGFADLAICSAAFTGIELSQVARAVVQLGGVFEEEFRRSVSLVVCRDLGAMRKEKLRLAMSWGVPVVSADWLWECISTGFRVPIDDFVLQPGAGKDKAPDKARSKATAQRTRSEPIQQQRNVTTKSGTSRAHARAGVDTTGFDRDSPARQTTRPVKEESATSADFQTARTQPIDPSGRGHDAALTELSSASLNKSPSPTKPATAPLRTKSDPPAKTTDHPGTASPERAPSAPPAATVPAQSINEADEKAAARHHARVAERRVLSSKLTDLIDSRTPAAGHPSASDAAAAESHQSAPARPRRRQILGRAISNVSAGSSAAGGAADHHHSAKSAPGSLRVAGGGAETDEEDGEVAAPPATQLEYVDPEAQEARVALMSRMMGEEGSGAAAAGAPGADVEGTSIVGGRALRKR